MNRIIAIILIRNLITLSCDITPKLQILYYNNHSNPLLADGATANYE